MVQLGIKMMTVMLEMMKDDVPNSLNEKEIPAEQSFVKNLELVSTQELRAK